MGKHVSPSVHSLPRENNHPNLGILKGPHGEIGGGYHPVVSFISQVLPPNKVLIINVSY